MEQRPESITVVSWILLVFSGFGYLGSLMAWAVRDTPIMQQMLARTHLPITVMVGVGLLGMTVRTLCAVGLLKRIGWARHVYVAWSVSMLDYGYWISPYPLFLIPNLVFTVVVAVVLFLPANNAWFAKASGA